MFLSSLSFVHYLVSFKLQFVTQKHKFDKSSGKKLTKSVPIG